MMLNTGDIPNLYEKEERLEIIEKVGLLQHQLGLIGMPMLVFIYIILIDHCPC